MMNVLLCSIVIFTLVTIYLFYKINSKDLFDKVLLCYLFYTLFHVLYTAIVKNVFAEREYLDLGAPFAFGYGPVFYFGFIASTQAIKSFSRRRVILHLLPFFFFILLFTLIILFPLVRNTYLKRYFLILVSMESISMLGYALWGLFYKGIQTSGIFKESRQLLGMSAIVFITIGFLFLIITYTKLIPHTGTPTMLPFYIIYCSMLAVVYLAFKYTIGRFLRISNAKPETLKVSSDKKILQYEKSGLDDELLDEYEKRLRRVMTEEKLYLDQELSLENLAKLLKMPKHHLTQVLSSRIKKNFYQYINSYRIAHACMLLKEQKKDMTIEALAFESGFNAKVTFNRYFKSQMGCTPSNYILKAEFDDVSI